MRDFVHEFKERIRKVNGNETKPITIKPPEKGKEVKDDPKARYRIVGKTLPYSRDRYVFFGLTLAESKAILLWPRFWTKTIGEDDNGKLIWQFWDYEVML